MTNETYRYKCGALYEYSEKNAAYVCVFSSTCSTKSGAVRAYRRALDKEQCDLAHLGQKPHWSARNRPLAAKQIETFTAAYIVAMMWSSTDENDGALDLNYNEDDIAPETMLRIRADCASFCYANGVWLGDKMEQGGHDFWLTRCGHGAGFWDRDGIYPQPNSNTALTKASEGFGNIDPYIADGKVYL